MNHLTFVAMGVLPDFLTDLHCVACARPFQSIAVRDVAVRIRNPGMVRALLEGKAHLTADSLHLTTDHQNAEAQHSNVMQWLRRA